jgi:hypothetical protein
LGIGDWGLGIGDWGLGPIPNPQSPIPNPHPQSNLIWINNKQNNIKKRNKINSLDNKKIGKNDFNNIENNILFEKEYKY